VWFPLWAQSVSEIAASLAEGKLVDMSDKIEVSVGKLEVQVDRLETDVGEIKGDIKHILKTLDTATGGWKTLLMVGGFSAAVGGLVAKMMSIWFIK